jgi:hypothetical protein
MLTPTWLLDSMQHETTILKHPAASVAPERLAYRPTE